MTRLALIDNGAVVAYPYQMAQLRDDNPNVSFPSDGIDAETLAEFGVVVVGDTEQPVIGVMERAVELEPVQDGNGNWVQQWGIEIVDRANIAPITRRQARLMLLSIGKLDDVDSALAALPSPQREAAQIEWQDALTFERTHPLIETMGVALNLTDEQIDQLFISAAGL